MYIYGCRLQDDCRDYIHGCRLLSSTTWRPGCLLRAPLTPRHICTNEELPLPPTLGPVLRVYIEAPTCRDAQASKHSRALRLAGRRQPRRSLDERAGIIHRRGAPLPPPPKVLSSPLLPIFEASPRALTIYTIHTYMQLSTRGDNLDVYFCIFRSPQDRPGGTAPAPPLPQHTAARTRPRARAHPVKKQEK